MKHARSNSTRKARNSLSRAVYWSVAAGCLSAAAPLMAAEPTIALIADRFQGNLPQGQHDWPDGVYKIQRLIKGSPEFTKLNAKLEVHYAGFPSDLSELDDADVIVLYFGTKGGKNPLEDPKIKAKVDALMDRGVGLVALHQAFTVANGNAVPFDEWLGGHRIAVKDYTMETAPLTVATPAHPVARGLSSFAYLDEFYPSIEFGAGAKNTPILTAKVHTQYRGRDAVFEEPSQQRVAAWAHERSGGGRSFGYSGGHFLESFDKPEVRKLVLNAIMWAAGEEVPQAGVTTTLPELNRVVLPSSEVQLLPQEWGMLKWFASREIGNSATMTVGEATVAPGKFNPPHWHPNTDEILHVAQGHIMHRVGDKEYEMKAGDTVVIPEGTVHNARNIGTEPAILWVSFNSADRVSLGE